MERAEAGDDAAVDELADIAAADPGALTPYHVRLLDAHVFWRPDVLYRGADEHFQRTVVDRVESGASDATTRLVHVLAQTRGAVAEDAFRRWTQSPPPVPDFDPFDRGVATLVRDGGWELAADGARELCGAAAYRLVPEKGDDRAEGTCPWCAGSLWVALDVDTADPKVADALAHTGWQGRLRIVTCHLCSAYGTAYCEVTQDGGATWSAHNERPEYLPEGIFGELPQVRCTPGERRPTPHHASAWEGEGSTLGGSPDWIQDPDYLTCPKCGKSMDYVGLVNGADLYEYGEGAHYLHLHAPCGMAAVNYQQS